MRLAAVAGGAVALAWPGLANVVQQPGFETVQ